MTGKSQRNRSKPVKRSIGRRSRRRRSHKSSAGTSPQTKKDRVVAMLRHPEGAPLATIVKATGWKPHTVRAFFSSVVRRKLRFDLKSEQRNGRRLYRIIGPLASALDGEDLSVR